MAVSTCKATASSSGAVRVRHLAQGHLHTGGEKTRNLLVTSHPTEPHAAQNSEIWVWPRFNLYAFCEPCARHRTIIYRVIVLRNVRLLSCPAPASVWNEADVQEPSGIFRGQSAATKQSLPAGRVFQTQSLQCEALWLPSEMFSKQAVSLRQKSVKSEWERGECMTGGHSRWYLCLSVCKESTECVNSC